MKKLFLGLVQSCVPLFLRKKAALWLNRRTWISRRDWWIMKLLGDWGRKDNKAFHKFLWSNHLAYANYYDVSRRFRSGQMDLSRRMFFSDLMSRMKEEGIDPQKDIRSVLDVGCSLGYHLRYLETEFLPRLEILKGLDIDRQAVEEGGAYLQSQGSKIQLFCADMENMGSVIGEETFDLVLCCGVLLYLEEADARRLVGALVKRTRRLLGLSGLAYSRSDNAVLQNSVYRKEDQGSIHNLDRMVKEAGGTVLGRRWEGDRRYDNHSIYFIFAGGAKD